MRNTQDLRGDNIIDSRDLIARRDYLAEELADRLADRLSVEETPEGIKAVQTEWDSSDDAEELRDIEAFLEEGTREFQHGETLIRDSYFEEYARELAEGVSDYNARSESWPFTCIDWEKAAEELKQDYTYAELGGYTYWFRNC